MGWNSKHDQRERRDYCLGKYTNYAMNMFSTMTHEISPQCLCQTKANAEITKLLMGVRRHHKALGLPMPEMMVTDNCCQVCQAVESTLPETDCILDVWHFIAR